MESIAEIYIKKPKQSNHQNSSDKNRNQRGSDSELINYYQLLEIVSQEQLKEQQQILSQEIQDQMVFEDNPELEQDNLLYQKQARLGTSEKYKEYQQKYAPQQQMNPSQKIEKKLEEDRKKQKKEKDFIHSKQLYFKQRYEQFENQEIIKKLQDSFFNHQSSFNTLWEDSENNLQAQIDVIQEDILKPIQVVLSEKEKNIILKNQNQLVIGRSGTGKTTTAVVKLSSMQLSYQKEQKKNSIYSEQLRICFTTISNFLTLDVENFFLRVMNKQQIRSFSQPNTLSQVKEWPHFSNIKQLILQIDGNLVVPFIQRDYDGEVKLQVSMEINLENRLRVQLKDQSEKDFYVEIGIKQFVEEFWVQNKTNFNQLRVDPYITFSQINSYITGHPSSHNNENNMISLKEYINLVGKNKDCLDQEQKENIYHICYLYQKWKHTKRYFDMNDIINYDIKNILEGYYDAQNGYFHYLFLDEVQDLNCACLYLLCLLTEQNVYLGGDTAQTISQENSFRFSDLQAIFGENNKLFGYDVNKVLEQKINEVQLIQNFRSHGQIIELNNTIVRILEIFFPTSLDHLKPEISLKNGPKPVLLSQRNHLYQFLQQDSEANADVDYFGRLQIYIVKDQEQKENLKKILQNEGKKGQIFTVLESKGLEFQDVIAYNLLSSSYKSTKCWNALSLLTIKEENIAIEEFKLKYNCDMKEEFQGSTFRRLRDSNFITIKTISKKDSADAQIAKEYSSEFNKLINELKNIYVTFSRARSRIFIYEDSVFVGKQIKNPIIKFLENLKLLEQSEINEESIKDILNHHYKYIQKNEPIKNNKQQFISMAEMLIERNQFLDAAFYYQSINDTKNYKICIAKNTIIGIQKELEKKQDLFEKEKKQILSGQGDIKNIQFYLNIKKQFMKVIQDLQYPKEQELNAQIYFKLGMYNDAILKYKEFKKYLLEQPNQEQKKIREINNNIKHIYFLKANLLETSANNERDLQQNYQDLENFLEKDGVSDAKVQLYLSFRLNDSEKLFKNLIKFKENNLIQKEDLIHILHYYYPKILDIKLQKIMDINIANNNTKLKISQSKQILGQVLIDLIQQIIIPFEDEFIRITKSRQNMEFFQGQLDFFNTLAKTGQLQKLDEEQNYLNGKNLMLFYIMLVQFDCLQQQQRFIDILQSQPLSHQIFIDRILEINQEKDKLQVVFDQIQDKSYLKSGNGINLDFQYYYTYLGLYQYLKSSKLVLSTEESKEYDQYLDFTFKLSNLDKQTEMDSIYYQMSLIQKQIVSFNIFELDKIKFYQNRLKDYHNIVRFLTFHSQCQQNQNYNNNFYMIQLTIATNNIIEVIEKYITKGQSKIAKFVNFQDYFLHFFNILNTLKTENMELFDNNDIESLTSLINFIFNFDIQYSKKYVKGEQNKIFMDAFCSCFGFVDPFLPGSGCDILTLNKEEKSVWQLIGINDYYLVHKDNPILVTDFLEKKKLISPLISKDQTKLKIIDKKTAILLSKMKFGDQCTQFLDNYSKFLMNRTKDRTFYYLPAQNKIDYPFQILFLNEQLQKLINKIQEQVNILEQNIPKKHTREHEIESITQMIDEIKQSDQQKLENLKQLLHKKINHQKRDQKQIKIKQKKGKAVKDNQIIKYKRHIIESGLVINQNFQNRNEVIEKTQIQQFLLEEAKKTLAQIINMINQSENYQEKNDIFEKEKQQFLILKQKYVQEYDQYLNNNKNQTINQEQENEEFLQIIQDKNQKQLTEQIRLTKKDSKLEQSEKEEEQQEDEEENEEQNILQSCDDILYVITILNMLNMRPVISDLLRPYQQNQLVQLSILCTDFFEARDNYNRIKIGQLSIELIQYYKEYINYFTQLNILKIGLAEIFLLINTYYKYDKILVCIPPGFENCFTYEEQEQIKIYSYSKNVDYQQIYLYINGVLDLLENYDLSFINKISICNMVLQILIIFLKKKTNILKQQDFLKKIYSFLEFFQKGIKYMNNYEEPFKSREQYEELSKNAYYRAYAQDDQQIIYFKFMKRFHKTFLLLVKKELDPQNKNSEEKFNLIEFINCIRYAEIQHILIKYGKHTRITNCSLQIQFLKEQQQQKNSQLIDQEQEIKSDIKKISEKMKQNMEEGEEQEKLTLDDYVKMFYQPDFFIFLNQVLDNNNIQQSNQTFQDSFLKAVIQVQKTRKIFLQELNTNKLKSSEKYIYIIQKLNSINKIETQFYKNLVSNYSQDSNFDILIQNESTDCIDQMRNVYFDYLHYITEPFEKIEKEKLDIQKFISEQINLQD